MLARLHPDYKVKWELPLQPSESIIDPKSVPSEPAENQREVPTDEECSISSDYSVIRPVLTFSNYFPPSLSFTGLTRLKAGKLTVTQATN